MEKFFGRRKAWKIIQQENLVNEIREIPSSWTLMNEMISQKKKLLIKLEIFWSTIPRKTSNFHQLTG